MDQEAGRVVAQVPEFKMPSERVLRIWWTNLRFCMAEANKANRKYEEAAAKLKARKEANSWNDTVYRDICKKDYDLNDALDAWRFFSAEVQRFSAAIKAAADMRALMGP